MKRLLAGLINLFRDPPERDNDATKPLDSRSEAVQKDRKALQEGIDRLAHNRVGHKRIQRARSYRPKDSDRPRDSYRPVDSYRPIYSYRPIDSYRPRKSYRPIDSYRPTYSYRAKDSYRPIYSYRPTQNVEPRQKAPHVSKHGGAPFLRIRRTPADRSFQAAVALITQLTGYIFNDAYLLQEALYVGPVAVMGGRKVYEANKRLALVGDRALAMAWWDAWFFRPESRGAGQQDFEKASTNRALAKVGYDLGLDDFVLRDGERGASYLNGTQMATTVEAIIGAVWLDSHQNIAAVKCVLIGMLGKETVGSLAKLNGI